jgi:hypothetical protein
VRVHRILLGTIRTAGRALAVGVLSIVLSALAARPALAYCRTTTCAVTSPPIECVRDLNNCWASGIPLFWRPRCLTFSVGAAGSPKLGLDYTAAEALVNKGFQLWPSALCNGVYAPSIEIESRGPELCDRREYNSTGPNANAVLFRDSAWPYDDSIIALTSVVFNSRSGEILGADMEINSGGYPQLTPINIEYVVAHESGHFFGLDHSPDATAIMYFQYGLDRTDQPVLQPDDVDAICAAYPPSRITPECTFELPKGFATDCGGDVVASCAVAPAPRAARGKRTAAWIAAMAIACAATIYRLRRRR